MKKFFTLGLMAMLAGASVTAQTLKKFQPTEAESGFAVMHLSTDGKYISGTTGAHQPFIADWKNDDFKIFEVSAEGSSNSYWVTNAGVGVGDAGEIAGVKFDFQTGEYSVVEDGYALCNAISEDGTIIVGTVVQDFWLQTATYWENGVKKELELPASDEITFGLQGSKALYISADGSVIVGALIADNGMEPMILWTRQADNSYKLDFVTKDLFGMPDYDEDWNLYCDAPYLMFDARAISPDGTKIAIAVAETNEENLEAWTLPSTLAIYNTETKELELFPITDESGFEADGITPFAIADDGTVVGAAEIYGKSFWDPNIRLGIIKKADEKFPRLFSEVYSQFEEFATWETEYLFHSVATISADGRYIGGFTKDEDFNWIGYVLDTNNETGVGSINAQPNDKAEYYTIEGRKVDAPVKGLNIVRMSNGETKKIVVK